MKRLPRVRVLAATGLIALTSALLSAPPVSAVPVAVGEGDGTGYATYTSAGTNFPPPCSVFTSADYKSNFPSAIVQIREPGGAGKARYAGPIAIHLVATDNKWYADPTTEYNDPDPTPLDGNGCVGNPGGYGIPFAGSLSEPTGSAAPGTAFCGSLSGKVRRVSLELVYSVSGRCTVVDREDGNTITGKANVIISSTLMRREDPTGEDACNGGPPSACHSTDAFVIGPTT